MPTSASTSTSISTAPSTSKKGPQSRTLLAALALTMVGVVAGCHSSHSDSKGQPTMDQEEISHEHHTIDYIELTVTDLAEAKRFYAAAFGWSFNDYGPEYSGIRRSGGGEVGGMRQDADVQRGGPLVVLYSTDLEGSEKAVRDAGGQIAVEAFSFPGGRRFHFLDPSGNELAVWSEK